MKSPATVRFNAEVAKALRVANRKTVSEFAIELGLSSQGHLSNIENGKRQPSWGIVEKFAEKLGVSPSALVLHPADPFTLSTWPHAQGRRTDRVAA
jgi:transcriptional regulator with XRE-family HTH domain